LIAIPLAKTSSLTLAQGVGGTKLEMLTEPKPRQYIRIYQKAKDADVETRAAPKGGKHGRGRAAALTLGNAISAAPSKSTKGKKLVKKRGRKPKSASAPTAPSKPASPVPASIMSYNPRSDRMKRQSAIAAEPGISQAATVEAALQAKRLAGKASFSSLDDDVGADDQGPDSDVEEDVWKLRMAKAEDRSCYCGACRGERSGCDRVMPAYRQRQL
jgi:hypothetical protein